MPKKTTGTKIEKTKIVQWFDKKKNAIIFGIDALVNSEWVHMSENNKPLFFTDRKDALKKKREINLQ
jgi:hypothetical protein